MCYDLDTSQTERIARSLTETNSHIVERRRRFESCKVWYILPSMLSNNFTLTKRHIGLILLIGGILAFAGIIAIDLLDAGREGGIGPAQQIALAFSAFAALLGLSLIPLGNTPA